MIEMLPFNISSIIHYIEQDFKTGFHIIFKAKKKKKLRAHLKIHSVWNDEGRGLSGLSAPIIRYMTLP